MEGSVAAADSRLHIDRILEINSSARLMRSDVRNSSTIEDVKFLTQAIRKMYLLKSVSEFDEILQICVIS